MANNTPVTPSMSSILSNIAAPFKAITSAPAANPSPAVPSLFSSLTTQAAKTPTATSPVYPTPNGQPIPAVPNLGNSQNSGALTANMGPSSVPAVPKVSSGGSYTTVAGDTLGAIAARNGMSLDQLTALNPQFKANPNALGTGVALNLGGGSAAPTGPSPAAAKIQVTPSGSVVNGNTGGVVSPAGSGSVLGASTTAAPATPIVPDNSAVGTPSTDPLNSPLYTSPAYQAALAAYTGLQSPTADETQNATDLANLDSSYRTAYTNAEGQPIPLEFITGQQKRLQESETNLAAPLQAQATLLQAKRQLAQNAAAATLDAEKGKIDAYRSYNTPTGVSVGTTLVNPATGTTVFGGGQSEQIGQAIADGRLTPDMVTRYGQAAILQALQIDPGYNFVTQKASVASDASSLKTQQDYADTTSRAYATATANLKVLNDLVASSGLNQSGIPLINQITNKVKANLTDPGAVASFNTALTGLRTEYAQVLSRGGQVTDTARNEATELIPDNISPEQLQQVVTQLSAEGANAVKEANQKVADIKTRIGSNSGSSANSGSSGAAIGDSWDNL